MDTYTIAQTLQPLFESLGITDSSPTLLLDVKTFTLASFWVLSRKHADIVFYLNPASGLDQSCSKIFSTTISHVRMWYILPER